MVAVFQPAEVYSLLEKTILMVSAPSIVTAEGKTNRSATW
jgi:hypothetical protein